MVAVALTYIFNSYLDKVPCLLSFGPSKLLGLLRQGINNNLQQKYLNFQTDYDSKIDHHLLI